jgi:hypothetical protein
MIMQIPIVKQQVIKQQIRTILGVAILGMAALTVQPSSAQAQSGESFVTENYRIRITNNCGEGVVVCNDMTYYGENLKTGRSITLKGRTVHSLCNDGVTPCRFDGYVFKSGDYRYVVTISNSLIVYKGDREILYERSRSRPRE